jgi:hypothetical protein
MLFLVQFSRKILMYLKRKFSYNFHQTPFNTLQEKDQLVVEIGSRRNKSIMCENYFIIWLKILL